LRPKYRHVDWGIFEKPYYRYICLRSKLKTPMYAYTEVHVLRWKYRHIEKGGILAKYSIGI